MSYESGCHFSPLLQYTTATNFYTTINSITFVARTMETCGPSIVLKTYKCLLEHDMRFLADGIVDFRTMRREHFAIYASLGEVNF